MEMRTTRVDVEEKCQMRVITPKGLNEQDKTTTVNLLPVAVLHNLLNFALKLEDSDPL